MEEEDGARGFWSTPSLERFCKRSCPGRLISLVLKSTMRVLEGADAAAYQVVAPHKIVNCVRQVEKSIVWGKHSTVCRASIAHVRQSWPGSVRGFQVNVLKASQGVLSPFGSGPGKRVSRQDLCGGGRVFERDLPGYEPPCEMCYRGTSLIRDASLLQPYSRTMPRYQWRS